MTKPLKWIQKKKYIIATVFGTVLTLFITSKSIIRAMEFRPLKKRSSPDYEQFLTLPELNITHTTRNEIAPCMSWPNGKPLSRMKFRTCAYVTGSGHLLDSNAGPEIDAHDCVIRSNDAPTRGYEGDVGRRTTIRTVESASLAYILQSLDYNWFLFDKDILQHTLLINYHETQESYDTMKAIQETWPTISLAKFTPHKIAEVKKLFAKEIDAIENNIWISNAFYTLLLARDICDEINVYGIGDADYCQRLYDGQEGTKNVGYHYYLYQNFITECWNFNRFARRTTSAHRYLKEKRLFNRWIKEWKNLHFRYPEWPQDI